LKEAADVENLNRNPSAGTIARLRTVGRDTLSKAEMFTVAALGHGVRAAIMLPWSNGQTEGQITRFELV
jgi:hypothetical protein